jgi:hypothetical protein
MKPMSKPEMPINISEMAAVSTLRSRWHFTAPVPLAGATGFRGAAVDVEVAGLRSTLLTYSAFIAQLKFRTASEWAVSSGGPSGSRFELIFPSRAGRDVDQYILPTVA